MIQFDQTLLEKALGDLIRGLGVSENVYPSRPRSSASDLKDFVVCHVSGMVRDDAAYGVCDVEISLFARDVSNMKNSPKLSVMQGKLKTLPAEIGSFVFDLRGMHTVGDSSDGNGYHVRIVQLRKVIIKIV